MSGMLRNATGKITWLGRATVLLASLAAILVAGCSEQSDAPRNSQAGSQKPKTVVVNEGMSMEEERLRPRRSPSVLLGCGDWKLQLHLQRAQLLLSESGHRGRVGGG
jgi:hypothetical protein